MTTNITLPREVVLQEREKFESWYVTNAFNLDRDPLGSRDCSIKWEAWIARAALATEHSYDQTALELCEVCGWKTLIPGDCCLNCERGKATEQPAQGEAESNLKGIDAGPISEWVDLVRGGYVKKSECLIMVKDIPLWASKNAALLSNAQPAQCKVCRGTGEVEQFTSAAAPKVQMRCFACKGAKTFFADKNPEAQWIKQCQRDAQLAQEPELQFGMDVEQPAQVPPTDVDWQAVGRIIDAHSSRGPLVAGTSNWGAMIYRACHGMQPIQPKE